MLKKDINKKSVLAVAMLSAMSYSSVSSAALGYSNDFESFDGSGGNTDIAGFAIGNIVDGGAGWFAGAAAPGNYNTGYSAIVSEGGAAQGTQQISVFNDYNPWSPFGDPSTPPTVTIQAFVSTDVGAITADMVGNIYDFSFDAKLGNLAAPSQAEAFVKVLKSSDASFNELANNVFDSDANLTTDWSGGTISLLVDAGMVGELLQLGFNNTATDYGATGVVYDNLNFSAQAVSAVPVPAAVWLFGSGLLGLVGVARRRKS